MMPRTLLARTFLLLAGAFVICGATTNGFEIARQDLQLRGPGEFIGSRQSGVPLLRYADLEADAGLVDLAVFVKVAGLHGCCRRYGGARGSGR